MNRWGVISDPRSGRSGTRDLDVEGLPYLPPGGKRRAAASLSERMPALVCAPLGPESAGAGSGATGSGFLRVSEVRGPKGGRS
jgi:hypothetical protein